MYLSRSGKARRWRRTQAAPPSCWPADTRTSNGPDGSSARCSSTPGSAGLAYDYHQPDDDYKLSPVAEYAVAFVDDLGLSVEFRRVPYSPSDVGRAATTNGRPYAAEWVDQWVPG
jgi:hypothetical protein